MRPPKLSVELAADTGVWRWAVANSIDAQQRVNVKSRRGKSPGGLRGRDGNHELSIDARPANN